MIVIPKNKNKQRGWYFPLCSNKISKKIAFTESCKYNSGDQQSDLHKIFGIGVFHLFNSFKTTKNKKWWELHKWLSLRVGWRYNIIEDVFEVTDYSYVNGIGERDTRDNKIFKIKVENYFTPVIEFKWNRMVMYIITDLGEHIEINSIPIKLPLIPIYLKLRAYVGSGYTTNKDIKINTIS